MIPQPDKKPLSPRKQDALARFRAVVDRYSEQWLADIAEGRRDPPSRPPKPRVDGQPALERKQFALLSDAAKRKVIRRALYRMLTKHAEDCRETGTRQPFALPSPR